MIALRDFETCAFCPRLCRHVCPVAVGTGREAATPTAMMTGPWAWLAGHGDREQALEAASLCVSCGACTRACKLQRPVPELLNELLNKELPPGDAEPLGAVEGDGALVAIEADGRRWAEALAERVGQPVARLRTGDHLGHRLLPDLLASEAHLSRLRARLSGRTAVVADAASLEVAQVAKVEVVHLAQLITPPELPVHTPCRGPAGAGVAAPDQLGCCGARDPLLQHHPDIARELGQELLRGLGSGPFLTTDARCGDHLRSCGGDARDPVSWLEVPA